MEEKHIHCNRQKILTSNWLNVLRNLFLANQGTEFDTDHDEYDFLIQSARLMEVDDGFILDLGFL